MIHRPCDSCGEIDSVDFMIKVDDDIFCEECYEDENTAPSTQED